MSAAVAAKQGRRWVTVGFLPREVTEGNLRDFLAALPSFGDAIVFDRSREYRLAWDSRARRWSLSVR